MRKSSLQRALLLAGAVALAGVGVAQAETFDSPMQAGEASTMTNGQPNKLTDNGPVMNYDWTLTSPPVVSYDTYTPSTTILGSGPATITTYSYTPSVCYTFSHPGASETSNVPLRAGEASTMTGGNPNALTNNYSC